MKTSENIHRLFDGELSAEEQKLLEEAMGENPELLEELDSIKSSAELHRQSMPLDKDANFIESEFQEIQNRIGNIDDAGESPFQPKQTTDGSKVVMFPGSNWLKGLSAIAAAAVVTVAGTWMWTHNQDPIPATSPSVQFVETDIDGASSMIFMDEQSGWTFVWVDEPLEESEMAG